MKIDPQTDLQLERVIHVPKAGGVRQYPATC